MVQGCMQPKMDEAEPDLIYSLNPLWLQAMQGPSQWTVTGSVWPDCVWGGHQQEGEEGEEREGARGPDGIRGPFLGMG